MKMIKFLAASLLAVSFAVSANAQTTIYITGSTAFRSGTIAGITAILPGATIATDSGLAASSANAVTFSGSSATFNGSTVIIKTSWSGSGAGVQTVAATSPAFTVRFLPIGATGSTSLDPRTAGNPADVERPDIALSDVYQAATSFRGTFNSVSYANLADNIVGILPFRWVASTGFPAGHTMTPALARYIWTGVGACPLALFTSNNSDEGTTVYATGRDADSGTRISAFAESTIGVFNTGITQYQPTISGGHVTALTGWPTQTINGVVYASPTGGISSGGTLRGYLNNVVDGTAPFGAGYLVTYLGASDAATTIGAGTNPAVSLQWNGVDFSFASVTEGQYTFWSKEHLFVRPSASTTANSFASSLTSNLRGSTSASLSPNISTIDMQVDRAADGALVTANYF